VRDRRGAAGGAGGGRGVAIGGVGSILVLLVAVALGVDPTALLDGGGGAPVDAPAGGALESCATGADIDANDDCRFVVYENSIQQFWDAEVTRAGDQYRPATFTTFSGGVSTGCGAASSQVGPFYCPADSGVYLDLGFFEVLRTRLGAQGGDFAEAYVVAHEYGHHIQNLTGQMQRVRTREGADSDAVRLELQADCFAGVWAHHATTTPAAGGEPLITDITEADIAEGIDAAEVIGDDYIQERFGGTVTPETWTHGSSEQRRRWFTTGLDTGDAGACDTFAAASL
jgi:predicted metalloprotease